MHDLTDDDRARLEKRYGSIEEIKRDFFPDLLAAERAAEKARCEGEPDELGDALAVVEAACLEAREERDEARRKLAEQSSGDRGLRITDEMVERGARAAFRSDHDHLGRPKNADVPLGDDERSAIRKVLEAALTDSTDDQQED